jgi:hypothetical protein
MWRRSKKATRAEILRLEEAPVPASDTASGTYDFQGFRAYFWVRNAAPQQQKKIFLQ